MNWQDEQRKLSEQYSRGEISAAEFRTRRDQLFAAANAPAQHPQQGSGPDTTQAMRPVSPPQGQQASEPTQAVGGPQQGTDPDRTQIVSGLGFPAPQGGYPQQGTPIPPQGQQPGAQGQFHDDPPWAGSEFPPLVGSGGSGWAGQGPEVFAPKKSNKGKIVAVVIVVVVVAGLAVGGYMLWGRGGSTTPIANPTTTQAPPPKPKPKPKPPKTFPIGKMPVKPYVRTDITSASQFASLHYFTDQELDAYKASGAHKAKMAVLKLSDGNLATLIFAQAADAQSAFTAAKKLNDIQLHNGRTQNPDEPPGVQVAEIDAKKVDGKTQPAGIRAHYSNGRVIVRVDVSGKSLDAVTPDFKTVLAAELKVLAPNA